MPRGLFTPVNAAVAFVEGVGGGPVLVVGSEAVTRQIGQSLELAGEPGSARHVIVGDCRASLSYGLLDEAFQALHGGAELVALQAGRFFLSGGRPHLDTGAVVAGLAYASGARLTWWVSPRWLSWRRRLIRLGWCLAVLLTCGSSEMMCRLMWRWVRRLGRRRCRFGPGSTVPTRGPGATYVIDSIADLPETFSHPDHVVSSCSMERVMRSSSGCGHVRVFRIWTR